MPCCDTLPTAHGTKQKARTAPVVLALYATRYVACCMRRLCAAAVASENARDMERLTARCVQHEAVLSLSLFPPIPLSVHAGMRG
jgi:hypothetical protein